MPAFTVLVGAAIYWQDKYKQEKTTVLGILSMFAVWGLHDWIYDYLEKYQSLPISLSGTGIIKVVWAVGLFLTLLDNEIVQRFFSSKVLVGLGKISFPIFAIHWPLMCSFSGYFLCNMQLRYEYRFWVVLFLTSCLLIIISYLYHVTLEHLSDIFVIYLKQRILSK